MTLKWHPQASLDADEAFDFYEERDSGLGIRFISAVETAAEDISSAPERWPSWSGVDPALGVRRRHLPKPFPYSIAYVSINSTVVVVAVAHYKRRPGYWVHRAAGLR